MVASSVSTYLDVTRLARGAGGGAAAQTPPDTELPSTDTETAAKVLAAIHAGADIVADIPAKADVSTEAALSAVAWLSENGLVSLDKSDGTLRADLTDAAKAALES
jgi:hypothetical protein